MSKAERPVLLIGALPTETATEAFQTVGPVLGDLALGLTDGEFGFRRLWIFYVFHNTWTKHPELKLIRTAEGVPGMPDWVPAGYHDFPWFEAPPDIAALSSIETLGYPAEAIESYAEFSRLRDAGTIPAGLRFQQSLPFPDDAARLFTGDPRTFDLMVDAYCDVLKRDVQTLCNAIPHADLVIQWDINWETIALEHGDHQPDTPPMQFAPTRPAAERYDRFIRELNAVVPAGVKLGLHLCYGDLHHKHFRDPNDLATSVAMTNRAVEISPRPIDFVHMSVPRHRSDDEFFAPLSDLRFPDGTVYAGVLHYTDGVEGCARRLETFKRHYQGPTGVSTECGLGRRPPEQDFARLLAIHREVAALI